LNNSSKSAKQTSCNLDQVRSAVDATVAELGRLDILVNNAGLAPPNPAEDVTEADFNPTVEVNLKAPSSPARRRSG
jgi:NAD(P)-dependent dehydrogenase (short-subunit alcohol dehydrogenase family)